MLDGAQEDIKYRRDSSLPDRKSVLRKKEEKKKRNAFQRSFSFIKRIKRRRKKMDASDVLLAQWMEQVKQIWSGMHQYRQEGIALAVLGIVLAGNAVMQRVAETLHERLSSLT